jgi:methionyl aminopeptidase
MDFIRPKVVPGVTTGQIDDYVVQYTRDHGHTPACLNYPGDKSPFPKGSCASVNEVVCHGIPGDYILHDGDIVNIDLTTIVDGWHGDQSETFAIGEVDKESLQLMQSSFDAMHLAIDALRPNCRVSVIGETIVRHIKEHYGFGVVEKYVGHGIGKHFHQLPNIPHVPTRQSRHDLLFPGVCFTIEPMINAGTKRTILLRDGWTVITADRRRSAQFEHTVLMTESGPEILTLTKNGPQKGHRFIC